MSTNKEYKIAVVGPEEMVSGFKALGVDVFSARSAEDSLAQLRKIKQMTVSPESESKYAVVCVLENVLKDVDQAEYSKIVNGPLPAVVILPGPEGSTGVALQRLRRLAEQAVGSAII